MLVTRPMSQASVTGAQGDRVILHEEVSMRRRTSKPRNPQPPAQRGDPRNPPAPLHSEGEGVDDTTPTPARPWPAITPAVDDDLRDRRPAR